MTEFKELLGKSISRLFLVVWPPWGEEKISETDISFGFVLKNEPNRLCVISVDKDELWLPYVTYQSLPQTKYTWDDFCARMTMWMHAEEDTDLIMGFEYYDVTKCKLFKNILNSEIIGVELIRIKDIPEPFGVKILFKDDYIISVPNTDGNTVETKAFNKHDSVEGFKYLGNVIYSEV